MKKFIIFLAILCTSANHRNGRNQGHRRNRVDRRLAGDQAYAKAEIYNRQMLIEEIAATKKYHYTRPNLIGRQHSKCSQAIPDANSIKGARLG